MRFYILEAILLAILFIVLMDFPKMWHMAVVEHELNKIEVLYGYR